MNIDDILKDSFNSLVYLERYVNDGSPSGFTEINRTSEPTDPFGKNENFRLTAFREEHLQFNSYGNKPVFNEDKYDVFYFHPDMKSKKDIEQTKKVETFKVAPTASARTVQILDPNNPFYVKLHYDGTIGRINRKLPYRKAINGLDVSRILSKEIDLGNLPSSFSILDELFLKSFVVPNKCPYKESWSYVIRDFKPYGKIAESINYMIPLFSFWSKDRLNPKHIKLCEQYSEKWNDNYVDKILSEFISPLINIYFSLILNVGFQNELNAQNILLGFDSNHNLQGIIFRDMMGVEKDITIRKTLGLNNNFLAADYKTIDADVDMNKWQIRHSFSFDFKFSEYIIKPIIETIPDSKARNNLSSKTKNIVKKWLKLLPDNYFPDNRIWYLHDNELLVDEKKYISKINPLYR